MKIYTIRDSKAEFYGQPFFSRTNGDAIRQFTQVLNDTSNPNNLAAKYPADYSLFEIGEFDDETGKIKAIAPNHLGGGVDFKTPEQK